jgi:prophage regulatory protein
MSSTPRFDRGKSLIMPNTMQAVADAPKRGDINQIARGEMPTLPATGFVRQGLLLRFVPFSKSTLWRRVKAGEFPTPVKLSEGVTAWRAEDVRRWISGRN